MTGMLQAANTSKSEESAHHPVLHCAGDKCQCACQRGIASNRQATLCSTICDSQAKPLSDYSFLFEVWASSKSCELVLHEAARSLHCK